MATFYSPQPEGLSAHDTWWSGTGPTAHAASDGGRHGFENAAWELQTAMARAGHQALLDGPTLQLLEQHVNATVQALRQNAGRRSIDWFEATSQVTFARIHGTGLVTRHSSPTSRVQAETTQRDDKTLGSLIAEKTAGLFGRNADFGTLTAAQRNRVCADIVVGAGVRHEQVLSTMRRLPHPGRRSMVLAMAVCAYAAAVASSTVRGTVAPGTKPGSSRGHDTHGAVPLTLHEFVVGALEVLDDGLGRFLKAAAAGADAVGGGSSVGLIPKDGYAPAPPKERTPGGFLGGVSEALDRFQATELGQVVQGLPPEGFIVGGVKGLAVLGSTERVAAKAAGSTLGQSGAEIAEAAGTVRVARKAEPVLDSNSAVNSANGLRLKKSLASEQQMDELTAGGGSVMAGNGSAVPLRDAPRLAAEHGGNPAEWSKVSSSSHTAADGSIYEVHAYRNTATGTVVEPKTIQPIKLPGKN